MILLLHGDHLCAQSSTNSKGTSIGIFPTIQDIYFLRTSLLPSNSTRPWRFHDACRDCQLYGTVSRPPHAVSSTFHVHRSTKLAFSMQTSIFFSSVVSPSVNLSLSYISSRFPCRSHLVTPVYTNAGFRGSHTFTISSNFLALLSSILSYPYTTFSVILDEKKSYERVCMSFLNVPALQAVFQKLTIAYNNIKLTHFPIWTPNSQ